MLDEVLGLEAGHRDHGCVSERAERLTALVLEENIATMRLLWSLGAEPRPTESGERWAELGTDPADFPTTPAGEALRHYAHLVAGHLG